MSERHDSYAGFAGHYDLYNWDWFASAYGERLINLLDERGLARCRVLDAGCGTGTLALMLAGRGCRVTGVDLSEAMLDVARLKEEASAVTWRQGDITRLDLGVRGEPFDLVTCVSDTLNHLDSLDEWENAFRRFAAHLRPGGALFFDVMTCRGLRRLDRFGADEVEGRTLLLNAIWEPSARRSTVKVTSFAPASGGPLYEKATETITEWGQSVSEIFGRLERARFSGPSRPWSRAEDPESEERLMAFAVKA
jgi:SAM-dependent methyltransferase